MLVRDYIDDHLYNVGIASFPFSHLVCSADFCIPQPNYGYFSSRSLEIFKTPTEHGYDFTNFRSSFHFTNEVARGYDDYLKEEDKARAELNARVAEARAVGEPFPVVQREQREGKQIWHTPTELFKVSGLSFVLKKDSADPFGQPWFGRAVARCLIADYKLKHFPYDDFVLYEMGAGNGTLMSNILDYLREEEPEVYERTQSISRPYHPSQCLSVADNSPPAGTGSSRFPLSLLRSSSRPPQLPDTTASSTS